MVGITHKPRASRSVGRLARDPKGETMFTNSHLLMIKLNNEEIQFTNYTTSLVPSWKPSSQSLLMLRSSSNHSDILFRKRRKLFLESDEEE